MLSDLLTRPCTILSRSSSGTTDQYGNDDELDTATETVCELQQTQRNEQPNEGELGASTWLLVLPAGTVVSTGDAIVVDGAEYELVGPAWPARNPLTGQEHHVEATVVRVAGSEEHGS